MAALNLDAYPPSPVLVASNTLDCVCAHLGCSHWREFAPEDWTQKGGWFSPEFRLESPVRSYFRPLLTYDDFLKERGASASIQSLKTWMFDTPSTTLGELQTPSSIMMLFPLVLIVRKLKRGLMPSFSAIGRKAAHQTHGKEWVQHNEIRITKFGEYVFRLVFHFCISVLGMCLFLDKEWWKIGGTKAVFVGYPNQPIDPSMTWYYLIQCAYNVDAMMSLLEMSVTFSFPLSIGWSKTCRGDFREMFIHHLITNCLIFGSSFLRLTRIGSMVFMVHDISDVPVDLSKLANFLKWKKATIFCFISMVLVWCCTRLGLLPFKIFRSLLLDPHYACQTEVSPEYEAVCPIYLKILRLCFANLMGLLIFLHLIWFTMFIQMGYMLVSKGEAHDLSEHKSGEALRVPPPSSNDKKLR